jgi:hypothetical protein
MGALEERVGYQADSGRVIKEDVWSDSLSANSKLAPGHPGLRNGPHQVLEKKAKKVRKVASLIRQRGTVEPEIAPAEAVFFPAIPGTGVAFASRIDRANHSI